MAFCFIEIAFTVLCCGFPTIFIIGVIYCSYCRNIYDWLSRKGIVGLVAMVIIIPGCLVVLSYTVYMFSIIFLDSFIFSHFYCSKFYEIQRILYVSSRLLKQTSDCSFSLVSLSLGNQPNSSVNISVL
jgi:predicted PurR-regulated permease PerM